MATPQSDARVLVIHGPNLNLLGMREPEIYGRTTLDELDRALVDAGTDLGLAVETRQANGEGAIIDLIHGARGCVGIIINPGGYTHTSVAIADALRGIEVPAIEVHLSNLFGRESMRHVSITGAACRGVIMGFGLDSYVAALQLLARRPSPSTAS
jgi:3-dehydroquinate dehydratase II